MSEDINNFNAALRLRDLSEDVMVTRLDLYSCHMERWKDLPPQHYMVPMAVRLLAVRLRMAMGVTYDGFCRMVSCNIPTAAEMARAELELRHAILVTMMARHQPPGEEMESMLQTLAEELAAIDCDDGQRRLRAFLDRMVKRYWLLERYTERKLSS